MYPFLKEASFRPCFCFVHTIAQFSRILRVSHIYCHIFHRVPHEWRKWQTTALTSTIGSEKFQKFIILAQYFLTLSLFRNLVDTIVWYLFSVHPFGTLLTLSCDIYSLFTHSEPCWHYRVIYVLCSSIRNLADTIVWYLDSVHLFAIFTFFPCLIQGTNKSWQDGIAQTIAIEMSSYFYFNH